MHFITFEGGDGCGKTTQSKLLAKLFATHNIDYLSTREPGGTPNAELVRELVLVGEKDKFLPVTELLLMFASRYEHIHRVIIPALAESKIVICDRFVDSSLAYQAYGSNLTPELILNLHQLIFGQFMPTITFILDLNCQLAKERVSNRKDKKDRYELLGEDFNKRVRDGYRQIAFDYKQRCYLLDASGDIYTIHQQIVALLNNSLKMNLEPLAEAFSHAL